MLEVFTTPKHDAKTAVINGEKMHTFAELKKLIAAQIAILKDKKQNIVICNEDNFSFIIQFWAALFCEKNIYLISDRSKLKEINFDYDIAQCRCENIEAEFAFKDIDINKAAINFFTSGSSGSAKIIKKSLFNLIREAEELSREFDITDKESAVVMSTTSMCHMFGLTFHLMFPLINGLKIYTSTVAMPEHVKFQNGILISTPAFLSCIKKYNAPFAKSPEYIFSAGSKLNDDIFEYLEKESKIIEIYGSTESGVIAYKTRPNTPFKLFKNVEVKVNEDNIEIISDFVFGKKITINDKIEINNRELYIKNRTDRLFKVNEKRISADELESKLKTNEFVKDAYILPQNEKLVCLCTLNPSGQKYLLENSIPKLTRVLKQYLYEFSEIVPQQWKFIDTLPMTKNGKIDKKVIEHIFNVNFSLPVILNRLIEGSSITYEIFFYNQCNFFQGHFPKFQLLPGVAQLYLAKELANIHYGLNLGEGQWKRIKFSNIIEPDSIVRLTLEKSDKQVSYEYFSDDKKYASGVFLCDNIFKEL